MLDDLDIIGFRDSLESFSLEHDLSISEVYIQFRTSHTHFVAMNFDSKFTHNYDSADRRRRVLEFMPKQHEELCESRRLEK